MVWCGTDRLALQLHFVFFLLCLHSSVARGGRSLEHQLVEKSGGDSPHDRASPVDPVVVPAAGHYTGPQAAGRVHAGSCERNGKQVAGGDGQPDGQGGGALHTSSVICIGSCSKHNQHQNQGDQELNTQSLQ